MAVPFLNLVKQYEGIKEKVDAAVAEVMSSARYIGGPNVTEFEKEFADYCETSCAVACANGTDGLYLSLRALELDPGDEVITTPLTFVASLGAIREAGATPVLVDAREDTLNINADLIEEKITDKTRAIMPVHLYGQPAEMDKILDLADRHGLGVVEDACQAHGSRYKGRRAGSMGTSGSFSFYPTKNLGAYGDGGCVTTNSEKFAEAIRSIADHGRTTWTHHAKEGINSRLDAIQAAVLRIKLRRLDEWNERRRKLAGIYLESLANIPEVRTLSIIEGAEPVYHLFIIRVSSRESVMEKLRERGIGCAIYYPVPAHLQPAFSFLGYGEGSFPVAEKATTEVLALPLYPEMDESQVPEVLVALKESL